MSDKHDTDAQSAQPSASGQPPVYPPIDPRLLASMYGMVQEDEIDLLAYWRIIWGRRKLILSVMLAAAIISAGISLLLPNIYQAQVLMAPVSSQDSGKSGGLAAALGGNLGGLASLAGVSLGSNDSAEQNLAVLQSRTFLWSFIKDNKLMPILYAKKWDVGKKAWKQSDPKKQPSLWDAYRKFTKKGLLYVSTDKDSGLVTVSVDWTDPAQAAEWANRLVARLNDYLRQQAIARSEANLKYLNEELQKTSLADVRQALFTLIAQEQKKAMIANTQKQYAFQVLDAAAPPDKKAKPHRSKVIILSVFISGLLAAFFVFFHERINVGQGGRLEHNGSEENR